MSLAGDTTNQPPFGAWEKRGWQYKTRLLKQTPWQGVEPGSKRFSGESALITTSKHGNVRLRSQAIGRRADRSKYSGATRPEALSFACGGGYDEIVKVLSRRDCSAEASDAFAIPISVTEWSGRDNLVTELLSYKI